MCDSGDDFVRRNNMLVILRVNSLKEAGFEKTYNFWFSYLFEYLNNIWCFPMQLDCPIKVGMYLPLTCAVINYEMAEKMYLWLAELM